MKPGRELDALVAEKVMGWTWSLDEKTGWWTLTSPEGRIGMCENKSVLIESGLHFPDYSTHISAAWEVVEKIKDRSGLDLLFSPTRKIWQATFTMEHPLRVENLSQEQTAPHAICLAALKAVGHQIETHT